MVGVSQAPARFLPAALMICADAHVAVLPPDARSLPQLLRTHARGSIPADIPDGIVASLSFAEVVCAFRAGATARDVIANLSSASAAKSSAQAGGDMDDVPPIDCLPDDLRALARDIIAGAEAYAAGRVKWAEVPTTAVLLAGPPGTGKTFFAKILAKAMGASLVMDSCGQIFARAGESGHLGTIARLLADAFDSARAAVRPASAGARRPASCASTSSRRSVPTGVS